MTHSEAATMLHGLVKEETERIEEFYCPERPGFPREIPVPIEALRALLDGYEAAVKRGEWKTVELPDEEDGTHFMMEFYVCSNCGKKVFFHSQKTPFCPQCGADMRGPEPGREGV